MYQNIMMTVVFFIIFIVMFSVYIYHLYDYIDYKESVDKSIGISTDHINKGFEKVSTNSKTFSKRLSETIDNIDAIKSDVQSVKQRDGNTARHIDEVKGDTNALKRRLDKLRRDIDAMNTQRTDVSGDIKGLSDRINGIINNTGINASNITELSRKQDEIIGIIDAMDKGIPDNQFDQYGKRIDDLSTRLTGFDSRFAELDVKDSVLIDEVNKTKANYSLLNDRHSELSSEVNGIRSSYSLLNDRHSELNNEVNGLKSSFGGLSGLTTDINDLKANRATNDSVKSIEDRFNAEKGSVQASFVTITDRLLVLDSNQSLMRANIQALIALSTDESFVANLAELRTMFNELNQKHDEVIKDIQVIQGIINSSFIQISRIQGLQTILDNVNQKNIEMANEIQGLKQASAVISEIVDGLSVKTSANLVDSKNFKICNESNNCMNFNTNSEGFNMTPDNVDSFTIRSKNKTAMGKFNLTNENLFLTGKVGIGTANPTSKLEVVADSGYVASFLHANLQRGIGIQSNTISPVGSLVNQDLVLSPKGTGVIRIGGRTVVNDSLDGGSRMGISLWNSTDQSWGIYMGQSGANKSFSTGTACHGINFSSYAMRLRVKKDSTEGIIYENDAEQCLLSIRSSDGMAYHRGNIGVQMQNPRYPLDVRNAMQVSTIDNPAEKSVIYLATPQELGAPSKCAIIANGINSWSRSKLHFCLENTTSSGIEGIASVNNARLTIQPDGKVGIGTTNPTHPLHVVGAINCTGDITTSGDVIAYFSDERLKTFVSDIKDPLGIIGKLKGFYYKPNDVARQNGITNTDTEIGLSAQEVQRVLPELVKPAPFDTVIDDDGNRSSKSGNDYLTMSYDRMAPVFVEAIKELKREIEELKATKREFEEFKRQFA